MADPVNDSQPIEPEEPTGQEHTTTPTEPQGTDWKAEARKWEQRAKENKAKADKWDEAEEAQKSELQREREAREKAEKALSEAKAEAEHMALVSKVAKTTGVPSELLHGSTEEELTSSAQAISEFAASKNPNYPLDKGGAPKAPEVTRESIDKITNPIERLNARAQNAHLYK